MHHAPWRHDETPAANKGARPRSDFGGERLSRCRSEPRHQCLLHGRALGNDGRHTGPLGTALPLPPHPWNGQSAALGWFGLWLISLRTHLAVRHDWRFVAGLWRRPLRSANGVARRVPSGLARQRSAQSLFHDDRPDRRLRDRRTSRLRRVLHPPRARDGQGLCGDLGAQLRSAGRVHGHACRSRGGQSQGHPGTHGHVRPLQPANSQGGSARAAAVAAAVGDIHGHPTAECHSAARHARTEPFREPVYSRTRPNGDAYTHPLTEPERSEQ